MKKAVVIAATALAMTGSAFAADMPVKAIAPPPPAFEPWDIAFGSALMSDYIFRGITQSDHKPSVAAYFEPRYNINKDVQLYIGTSGESISFPNRAAAEIDIYGGIRPTFGMFAFDFGVWGYLYPGGQCFGGVGSTTAAKRSTSRADALLGNVATATNKAGSTCTAVLQVSANGGKSWKTVSATHVLPAPANQAVFGFTATYPDGTGHLARVCVTLAGKRHCSTGW